MGDRISTVGDSFSTVEGTQYTGEITSLRAGDNVSTVGDNISPVEGIQCSGRRILACFAINKDKNISTFFVLYEIFIRSFEKSS